MYMCICKYTCIHINIFMYVALTEIYLHGFLAATVEKANVPMKSITLVRATLL